MNDINKSMWIQYEEKRIPKNNLYDLQRLFDHNGFDVDISFTKHGHLIAGNTSTEYPVMLWLIEIITDIGESDDMKEFATFFQSVHYAVSESISVSDRLSSLLSNVNIFPDTLMRVVVLERDVVFFSTEMQSGRNVDNNIARCISNVVDLFRLLRMHNPEIKRTHSFVFPKKIYETCVTKLECCFCPEKLRFVVTAKDLKIENVKKEVSAALKLLPSHFKTKELKLVRSYFIKLNEFELGQFGKLVKSSDTCKQIQTPRSFVITNGKRIWKKLGSSSNESAILKLRDLSPHVLSYSTIHSLDHLFEARALLSPLTLYEVKKCLKDFLVLVNEALCQLHLLNFAHCDIRIPNICFDLSDGGRYIAVLIDLDRACSVHGYDIPCYSGKYYDFPKKWKLNRLDFKQLGLTALDAVQTKGKFVTKLITEGMLYILLDLVTATLFSLHAGLWNHNLYKACKDLMLYNQYSVSDMLKKRN